MELNYRNVIGSLLTLVWWILTGIYHESVLTAYNSSNLPSALLTADSIFFGAIIVMISVLTSMSGTRESYPLVMTIIRPLLGLSGGIAILLLANVSAYLTSGWLQTLTIYYQIWTLPSFMVVFFSIMPYERLKVG